MPLLTLRVPWAGKEYDGVYDEYEQVVDAKCLYLQSQIVDSIQEVIRGTKYVWWRAENKRNPVPWRLPGIARYLCAITSWYVGLWSHLRASLSIDSVDFWLEE
jgi:hypothetical protein